MFFCSILQGFCQLAIQGDLPSFVVLVPSTKMYSSLKLMFFFGHRLTNLLYTFLIYLALIIEINVPILAFFVDLI